MQRLGMTEDELRAYITEQRAAYMRLDKPRGDFAWWLQVRLQCHKSTAERVLMWWVT